MKGKKNRVKITKNYLCILKKNIKTITVNGGFGGG